jgi:hypothetical protein
LTNDILSNEALCILTGYKQPAKQSAWLARAGIWFKPDRNGHPKTTWTHVNNPISLRPGNEQGTAMNTPNFDAINNGRKTQKSRR